MSIPVKVERARQRTEMERKIPIWEVKLQLLRAGKLEIGASRPTPPLRVQVRLAK